jgi:hypothetical protein
LELCTSDPGTLEQPLCNSGLYLRLVAGVYLIERPGSSWYCLLKASVYLGSRLVPRTAYSFQGVFSWSNEMLRPYPLSQSEMKSHQNFYEN